MARQLSTLLFLIYCAFTTIPTTFSQGPKQFIYDGFNRANLHLDGLATILPNGLLQLTNMSHEQKGHALYPLPLRLSASSMLSTTFVFAIYPQLSDTSGHGLAFVMSPTTDLRNTSAHVYLGIINSTRNGSPSNHVFAVELDTIQSAIFEDIDGNHVGIDVNSLKSITAASASYYSDKEQRNISLNLLSGKPMQVWIDYHAEKTQVNVAMAPLGEPKPSRILLSTRKINLSEILLDTIYIGFSASNGGGSSKHYILGWSFNQSGQANNLDFSKLPSLPGGKKKVNTPLVALSIIVAILLVTLVSIAYVKWRKKYEEVIEDWEEEYALQRFSYRDLYKATKGFKDIELLGAGGFGNVYKGILASSRTPVAVKRVSHDSRQGMKEFVSEIASMRRLRHRNLVPLLGYCRRRGELLLVYEYMPNGSLDKLLFDKETSILSWSQRFRIIRGVASALLYLHEEWEQVVLHRDVKASNILLDMNMDARLGDFGLARLYDHGTDPRTTLVVGTVGYLAPEFSRTGKATTGTDVFAFGTLVLEVACGRRPIEAQSHPKAVILVDWVWDCWNRGAVLEASDPRLMGEYNSKEMELVLKIGLLCSQLRPEERPSMRQVMQFLDGDVKLPELSLDSEEIGLFTKSTGTSALLFSDQGSTSYSYSTTESILKHGR